MAYSSAILPSRKALKDKSYVGLLVVSACLAAGVATGMNDGFIALGLLAAVAGAFTLFERPLLGALVLVSAVPALSGLDRGLPVPGLRISEVLIIGVAAMTLITTGAEPWRKFDWAALAYVFGTLAFGLFDVSSRGVALSGESIGKLIGPLEFLLLYRAVRSLAKSPHERRVIMKWALLASVAVSLLSLMQFANIAGTRHLAVAYAGETDSLEAHTTFYRATALFAQGHLLGSYLMLIVILTTAYLFDSKPTPLKRHTMLGILTLDAVGMGATATATPIIGAAVGIVALAYWYHRLGRALLALIIGGSCAIILFAPTISARLSAESAGGEASGGTPQTLAYRVHVWRAQYIPTIEQNLVSGYGPDLPPGSVWPFTESGYVTLLLRGGLPLLMLFGWLMWVMARRALRVDDDRRPVARAMFIVILTLAAMSLVDNYFFDSGFPQLWWGLAGILMAGTDRGDVRSGERVAARKEVPTLAGVYELGKL